MSDAAAHATISLAQSTQAINGQRGKGNFNIKPTAPPTRPEHLRPMTRRSATSADPRSVRVASPVAQLTAPYGRPIWNGGVLPDAPSRHARSRAVRLNGWRATLTAPDGPHGPSPSRIAAEKGRHCPGPGRVQLALTNASSDAAIAPGLLVAMSLTTCPNPPACAPALSATPTQLRPLGGGSALAIAGAVALAAVSMTPTMILRIRVPPFSASRV